jgi:hypothetical protein
MLFNFGLEFLDREGGRQLGLQEFEVLLHGGGKVGEKGRERRIWAWVSLGSVASRF